MKARRKWHSKVGWLGIFLVWTQATWAQTQVKPESSGWVAKVGTNEISALQFKTEYSKYLLRTGLKDDVRLRASMLETMIGTEMLVKDAEGRGVRQTKDYQDWENVVRQKLGVAIYTENRIYKGLTATESELQEVLKRAFTTMEARHLFAKTKEEADRLYARVLAGEDWNALAREVFTDTTLARHGGRVGSFGFDEMDPAFEEAAFRLKVGETAPPVQTAFGYSIIRLDYKFTKPIITEGEFALRKGRLETYVLTQKRRKARSAHLESLSQVLKIQFNSVSLRRMMAQIEGRYQPTNSEKPEAWLQQPLVSFGAPNQRQTWTVAQFRTFTARFTDPEQRTRISSEALLKDFITGLVLQNEMVRRADQLGLTRQPIFKAEVKRNLNEWIVRQEMMRLGKEVVVPEDSIRAIFERDKALLHSEERRQVWEILVDQLAEALRLKSQARVENFSELAKAYSLRPGAVEAGGLLGFVTQKELGGLGDRIWDAKPNEILGPFEVGGRYVLLMLGDRLPPLPLPYEEAKPALQNILWGQYSRAFMRQHRAKLDQKYAAQTTKNLNMVYGLNLKGD